MASIVPHGTKWRAHVHAGGVRQSKTFKTKREAQQWATKREEELERGNGGARLSQAIERYLKTVTPDKRSTVKWERARFSTLLEFVGDMPMKSITPDMLGKYRDHRKRTVSGSTVVREFNLYRHLFTLASGEWGLIPTNPAKGLRMPRENPARDVVWGWKDIRRVLRACHRSGPLTAEVGQAFRIALHTGLRLQEAVKAPEWFDRKRQVLVIPHSKASLVPESVPVPRRAVKALNIAPLSVMRTTASASFARICREIGVKGLTFHDARATALTLLARRVDVLTLAKISRHKDIRELANTYYRESAEAIAKRI